MLKLKVKDLEKKKFSVSSFALIMVLVFSSFSTINLQAQNKISGNVKDPSGISLPGVSVLVKGTTNGTATDFDGNYSLVLSPNSKTLIFSYIGYKSKEIAITNQTTINVTLEEEAEALKEIVIIGTLAVQEEKILGSTVGLKAASIEQAAPVDVLAGVQGKISGVQVTSNNGPGQGFDIIIRGLGTINGANGPLYVVDGQQTFDINNLNPADIEDFRVLKDGASTAPYGAQGANGVVLITTKNGKKGKVNVNVTSTTSLKSLLGKVPQANTRQRIVYERALDIQNTQLTRLDSLNLAFQNSLDAQDFITRVGFRHQTDVSISGGGEKSTFFWSAGFINDDPIIYNTGYKRINTRLKLDITPSKKFKLGTVVNLSFDETNGLSEAAVLKNALQRIPYIPIFEPNGDFLPTPPNYNGSGNPLQQLLLRKSDQRNYRANLFNYAQYKILPQLSFRSTLGIDFRYRRTDGLNPASLFVGGNANPSAFTTANQGHSSTYQIQQDNNLNYEQSFGKHNLSATVGMQLQVRRSEVLGLDTRLVNDLITTFNNADLDFLTTTNNTQNINGGQFSLFAAANYDYNDTYLFGATIRRDGSSNFGKANQIGYFPSVSFGWRVSKESFLKNVKSINNLLIRASYGIVGNDRIGNFLFNDALSPDAFYNGQIGFVPTRLGNETLKWEETTSMNLGIDLTMFKKRLNINADFWIREINDLLIASQLPLESGFRSVFENRGSIRNKGIDFSIDGLVLKTKDFKWNAGLNFGLLESKVTSLENPIIQGVNRIEEGQSLGNIFGFKQHGVFQYNESNAYNPTTGDRLIPVFNQGTFSGYNTPLGNSYTGAVRQLRHRASGRVLSGGDFMWDDLNNDGFIDNDDIQVLGNALPDIVGGFTSDFKYKDFSLGFLFDFSFGQEYYRQFEHERNSLRAFTLTAAPERIDGAWQQQGDITVYPILASAAARPQNRFDFASNTANSLYIEDASYIRWRYLRIGYSIPKKTLETLKLGSLSKFEINLQGNNLLTWTNYKGFDPELGTRGNNIQMGVDGLRFPASREIILSLRLQF
jgi:TonB-dependent starch-binding outer membrane protein SusC